MLAWICTPYAGLEDSECLLVRGSDHQQEDQWVRGQLHLRLALRCGKTSPTIAYTRDVIYTEVGRGEEKEKLAAEEKRDRQNEKKNKKQKNPRRRAFLHAFITVETITPM